MTELHQHVASLYEGQAEYCQAAIQLAAVPLENSQRNYSKEFKLQVRIMSTSLLPSNIVYRLEIESHLGPVMSTGIVFVVVFRSFCFLKSADCSSLNQ